MADTRLAPPRDFSARNFPAGTGLAFRDCPGASDVPAVRELLGDTGFFRPDEIGVAAELVEEGLAKGAASGYHFIFAEAGGQLAGYVCFGPIPCSIGSFDLYWLAVDKRLQGRGLGLGLAARCEAAARRMGARGIYAETSGKAQYLPTRRFYERAGFAEAARLPDFYAVGDAKIIYRKILV
ncbi:MAG: GNAT family N-acetyltransferase [Planctomycetota bacterium]|jgi:ribosomal protein S18 acetylase RimI-like enzyme|nr:GNAT family N-acetyltransferase [Planctomycetota bacterium]